MPVLAGACPGGGCRRCRAADAGRPRASSSFQEGVVRRILVDRRQAGAFCFWGVPLCDLWSAVRGDAEAFEMGAATDNGNRQESGRARPREDEMANLEPDWHSPYVTRREFLAALGVGLTVRGVGRQAVQAMQLTFFILLPSILLSGFMFPFDGMPRPAQIIAEALPMTHFMRLIRGVILRGATLVELYSEVLILVAFIFGAMTMAILRFNKRLD